MAMKSWSSLRDFFRHKTWLRLLPWRMTKFVPKTQAEELASRFAGTLMNLRRFDELFGGKPQNDDLDPNVLGTSVSASFAALL
jgi:hypothetical protein